jgi:hypothetical protein
MDNKSMKNLIVSCPTKEECEAVQKKMFSEGLKLYSGNDSLSDNWEIFKEHTCISSLKENNFRMLFGIDNYYNDYYHYIPIITAEEYLGKTMTKKLYIVVNKSKYKNDGKFKDIWISERKLDAEINLYKDQILIETTIDKIFEKGGLKEIEI